MRFLFVVVMVLVLAVAGPTMAATLFSDNFDDGNADGWVATDPGLWSMSGTQYLSDNYGGGRSFSMRPDITMPTDWVFSADLTPTYKGVSEPVGYAGLAIIGDQASPWSDYLTISLMLHPDANHVGIQIHWQTGANDTWTTGWTVGDAVRMTVTRAAGSDVLSTSIVSPHFSATLNSPALTGKLATSKTPTLYAYNDTYTLFDNVLITSSQVPEPGSLAVLASGLGCLFGVSRRRTK